MSKEMQFVDRVSDRESRRDFERLIAAGIGLAALVWFMLYA